jgi:hypothetical protein
VEIVFEPIDDACDAVFDERNVEVDEQPETFVGETEMVRGCFL